jgi:Flp pilus assembly protein TadD
MRKLILILLGCTAVLLAGYAGYRGYKVWKQNHMMALAHEFIAKSDGKNALLCVQQVLASNPRNLEASRLMAQMLEAARSQGALLWRSRIVEMNPKSLEDRLALAQTALALQDYAIATNALGGVNAAGRKTAGYHNIAGAVAAAANQTAQAETHFLEAIRLEPQNPAPQLNLAVVRLHGTNESEMVEARAALNRLCANPTNSALRCEALRELVVDAVRFKQNEGALALSRELVQQTNAVFRDRLLRLDVLRETRNAEFKPTLATFQRIAEGEPGKIKDLAMWQMTRTGPADALAWLQSLPLNTRTNPPATQLAAECQVLLGDWRSLQVSLEKQKWGELELIRHAFLARALRGQNLADSSKAEWEQALKSAEGQNGGLVMGGLVMLQQMAAQWKWQSESEEILWTIVNRYPTEKWARQRLSEALFVGGRTRSLMSLYSQEVKANPSDLSAKNNLAMTALLLEAVELKPHDLAREVYQKAPTNASFASTYAYSLHVQQKDAEALKVMRQLRPEELENPSIAGYYGIILKATGDKARARVYLDRAAKGPMLGEEKKLFDKARAGV